MSLRDFPTQQVSASDKFQTFQISLTTEQTKNSFFVDIELFKLLGRLGMFGMLTPLPIVNLGNPPFSSNHMVSGCHSQTQNQSIKL